MTVHIQRSVEKVKEFREEVLVNYIRQKRNTDECAGFIDGLNAAMNNRHEWLQPVEIPDGEVTEESFFKVINKVGVTLTDKEATKRLYYLHLADKARAVEEELHSFSAWCILKKKAMHTNDAAKLVIEYLTKQPK